MVLKYQLSKSSIYIEGTDIPKNRLNIDVSEDIHEAENILLEEAYKKVPQQLTQNTILNETYFINLHKKTIDYSGAIDNGAYINASIEAVQYADSSLLEKIVFEGLRLNE